MKKSISKENKVIAEYPFEVKLLTEKGDHYQETRDIIREGYIL